MATSLADKSNDQTASDHSQQSEYSARASRVEGSSTRRQLLGRHRLTANKFTTSSTETNNLTSAKEMHSARSPSTTTTTTTKLEGFTIHSRAEEFCSRALLLRVSLFWTPVVDSPSTKSSASRTSLPPGFLPTSPLLYSPLSVAQQLNTVDDEQEAPLCRRPSRRSTAWNPILSTKTKKKPPLVRSTKSPLWPIIFEEYRSLHGMLAEYSDCESFSDIKVVFEDNTDTLDRFKFELYAIFKARHF
ncbi:hypothetical protein KSP40_PGU006652 [Platanthera guangdongensis]|uniref:Uncharacterized protein n=1 Tax=Platanthera guangdongensis TaxID=2320717 RepID=A0ABR2MJU6_9ASPA